MQPKMCVKCRKNIAVVFITKMENGATLNEGYCLRCARGLGIPQIDAAVELEESVQVFCPYKDLASDFQRRHHVTAYELPECISAYTGEVSCFFNRQCDLFRHTLPPFCN